MDTLLELTLSTKFEELAEQWIRDAVRVKGKEWVLDMAWNEHILILEREQEEIQAVRFATQPRSKEDQCSQSQ